jgi:HNH endonuclease
VHHIIPARRGGSDALENLTTLCRRHHRAADRKRIPTYGGMGGVGNDSHIPRTVENLSPLCSDVSQAPEDDPENGICWGPAGPNGMHRRWSRPWFEWRDDPAFSR